MPDEEETIFRATPDQAEPLLKDNPAGYIEFDEKGNRIYPLLLSARWIKPFRRSSSGSSDFSGGDSGSSSDSGFDGNGSSNDW
ncbi:MAG: hypothetical protein JST42_28275 [Bacteroidetes bacterium]|nr:hypothetical protein [Bacteroidota bacterium]